MKIPPPDNAQETANAPENHIRQPETAQPISAETAHLSEEKAEQYKSLLQSAKYSACIAALLWVMALFMPANDIDNISGAGILLLLLLIGPGEMNPVFLVPLVGQLCLFSLCLIRMGGRPYKPAFIGDIFIWIGGAIGLVVLAKSIVIWFWLASAFFVTRAGLLHREAFQLSQSDTVQAAADNGDNETGTQNNEIQSSVQATAENNGGETVADASDDSDSPTPNNPPENRL